MLQVWRVDAFGEPAAERGKWVLGLLRLVLTARPYHPDMEEVRESILLEGASRPRSAISAACAAARCATATSAASGPAYRPGWCASVSSSPTSGIIGPSSRRVYVLAVDKKGGQTSIEESSASPNDSSY